MAGSGVPPPQTPREHWVGHAPATTSPGPFRPRRRAPGQSARARGPPRRPPPSPPTADGGMEPGRRVRAPELRWPGRAVPALGRKRGGSPGARLPRPPEPPRAQRNGSVNSRRQDPPQPRTFRGAAPGPGAPALRCGRPGGQDRCSRASESPAGRRGPPRHQRSADWNRG